MSHASQACPYCLSEIAPQALVCRQCSRDVSLFRTLLDKVARLEAENASMRTALDDFRKLEGSAMLQELEPAPTEPSIPVPPLRAWPLWLAGLGSVLLLGLLHWVLFFIYDTPTVVFRIVTFCVPVLLGFWAAGKGRCFWLHQWTLALLTGAASVVLMLGITHRIDDVPLWPQNLRDWRETLEYLASISLALLTGLWSWGAYARYQSAQRKASVLVLLQRDEKGRLKLEQLTSEVQNLLAALAPVFSGAMAIYSALKSLLG